MTSTNLLRRRDCFAAMPFVLATCIPLFQAKASTNAKVFAFSRSGSITPFGLQSLLLGGIVVEKSREQEIENELQEKAKDLSFRIPLDYSTNKHQPIYLKRALDVISKHDAFFTGAIVEHDGWDAETDTVSIWRRETEKHYMEKALGFSHVELLCLRHSREIDTKIYSELEQQLGLLPTRLFSSHKECPRLLQVAAVVIKSFASLHFSRTAKGATETMRRDVLAHFGVTDDVSSWDTDSLKIKRVQLNFG